MIKPTPNLIAIERARNEKKNEIDINGFCDFFPNFLYL